jgi:hypothetical protein
MAYVPFHLAHFLKSESYNIRENTFRAQLILMLKVLCSNGARYDSALNILVLQYAVYLEFVL